MLWCDVAMCVHLPARDQTTTMPSARRKTPELMTVAEFLAWPGDGTARKFQLVDGELRAMSPAGAAHGSIQTDLGYALRRHMIEQGSSCRVVTEPAIVTRVRSSIRPCRQLSQNSTQTSATAARKVLASLS